MYSGPDSTPRQGARQPGARFAGLERAQVERGRPGDIVLVTGIEGIGIGTTIADLESPKPLPMLPVDEPTLSMNFQRQQFAAGRHAKASTSPAAICATASTASC